MKRAELVHETVVHSTVTCVAWLAQRGLAELAETMRADFMEQTAVTPDEWNEQVDRLVEHAELKGGGDNSRALREVRLAERESDGHRDW
jgi:hypothetical protein